MNSGILNALVDNIQLLIIVSILYEASSVISIRFNYASRTIEGILIGIIGIALMANPLRFADGLIFDTRSILLASASLTFGGVSMLIAALLMITYRVYIGGVGLIMGIAVIIFSTVFGFYWRKRCLECLVKNRVINLVMYGILVHLGMLLCMFLLPYETAITTFKSLWLEIMMVYPLGTVLISLLLLAQKDHVSGQRKTIEAEEKYRSIFDNGHAPMMLLDTQSGQILDVNNAAIKFYGWTKEQMLAMNINQINTLSLEEIRAEMKKSEKGEKRIFEFKHRRANGVVTDVEVSSGPIVVNNTSRIYSIVHDVTERVAANKALRESEERFRLVVDAAPDAIFIQTNGKFSFANATCLDLFGAKSEEELLNKTVLDQIAPEFRKSVARRIKKLNDDKLPVEAVDEAFLRLDGSRVDVEAVAVPIRFNECDGAMVFARDISARKKLAMERLEWQAQVRQQQKLEAIGTLAGGVAHEINNPINIIMNYAQLSVDEAEEYPNSNFKLYGSSIIDESIRVSGIVKNLLQFSRQERQSHSYASVYDIVNRTVSLVNTIIKKDQILMRVDIEEGLPEMKCRSQQIQQVLMNLLTNARDALNEKYPTFDENKKIDLRVFQKEHDDRRWINIVVEDQGNGITEEVLEKIFEPFYSTKPKEKGTGLGLSISFGIVNDHHGSINIETKVNEYSRFIVELPVDNGWEVH